MAKNQELAPQAAQAASAAQMIPRAVPPKARAKAVPVEAPTSTKAYAPFKPAAVKAGGFKKVSTELRFCKWSEVSPGDILISGGTYERSEAGKFGGPNHYFRMPEGYTQVLNSAGQLNWLVEKHLTPGMVCNIIYAGKDVLKSGKFVGKESHNFELEIDDTFSHPAQPASAAVAAKRMKPVAPPTEDDTAGYDDTDDITL